MTRNAAVAAIAAAVGVVLADSSVVILALPEILARYDVSVATVAWVLTAYNLVLGLAAVPAAHAARRHPRAVFTAGIAVFSAASLGCALAPSLGALLAGRCVQALGGALAVTAALELLPGLLGSEAAAARRWAAAGALGTAVGPAAGGLLTQLISWQAIFVAQVPVAAAAAAVVATRPVRTAAPAGRPHLAANAALVLVSAALTAALFLVVLLMINGWGLEPVQAAVAVSVMPVAALVSGRWLGGLGGPAARAAAGALAVAAGLAALGLMPGASVAWTLPPQVLVGVGLGLTVGALTEAALAGRSPQGVHGGWTLASRHLGVVLGILLLTPVFVADLDRQQARAQDAVTAILLDSRVAPSTKIELAQAGERVLGTTDGRVPDLSPIFREVTPAQEDRAEFERLRSALGDQLDRAATASVARSFLAAAAFALLALLPVAVSRGRVRL
ncbi:MAG: MFS transporter [Thermoleophilia bacterium]|nr:MFS transporter [Thermoleophilia bacterium]